jgi:hypothetical protein
MSAESLLAKSMANLRPEERQRVASALDAVMALEQDGRWSPEGRKNEAAKYVGPLHKNLMTRYTALPDEIAGHRKQLDGLAKAAVTKARLDLDPGERMEATALGSVYRALPQADKDRLTSDWLLGKDDQGARLIAGIHPAVAGITPETQQRIRTMLVEPHIDHAQVEDVTNKLNKAQQEKASLAHVLSAVESMTDRAALRQASGSTLVRRSDLSDKQKSQFISEHGLDAFKQLPA